MKAGMRMLAVNNARRNRERMEMAGGGGGGSMEMRGGQMRNEMRGGQMGMEYGRMGGEEMRRGGGGRMEMGGDEMRRGGGRMEMAGGGRMEGSGMEYGQNYGGTENRMGGERYAESGGRAEMRGGMPESRFRDRQGRNRYNNGRFAPEGNGNRGGNRGAESRYPFFPPYYEGEGPGMEGTQMNRIGFDMTGGRREVEYQGGDEMNYRRGKQPQRGNAESRELPPFDKETAQEWVESMHNEDGSTGPHWTMEQVKPILQQKGIDEDPYEFWAILNAMYSDYCKVAKKHNVNTIDFYVDMAKSWLGDKDAVPDKAAAYYEYVVKHE